MELILKAVNIVQGTGAGSIQFALLDKDKKPDMNNPVVVVQLPDPGAAAEIIHGKEYLISIVPK